MDLEAITDRMEADINSRVGEAITYTPQDLPAIVRKAHVFYADQKTDLGAGLAIEQGITLKIAKLSLPHMPRSADRITLRRHPGITFMPTNPSTDDSGLDWIVNLKIVR